MHKYCTYKLNGEEMISAKRTKDLNRSLLGLVISLLFLATVDVAQAAPSCYDFFPQQAPPPFSSRIIELENQWMGLHHEVRHMMDVFLYYHVRHILGPFNGEVFVQALKSHLRLNRKRARQRYLRLMDLQIIELFIPRPDNPSSQIQLKLGSEVSDWINGRMNELEINRLDLADYAQALMEAQANYESDLQTLMAIRSSLIQTPDQTIPYGQTLDIIEQRLRVSRATAIKLFRKYVAEGLLEVDADFVQRRRHFNDSVHLGPAGQAVTEVIEQALIIE